MLDAADNTAIQALIATALAANGGILTKNEFSGTAAMLRGMNDSLTAMKTANPLDALVTAGVLEKKADGTYAAKAVTAAAPAKKEDVPAWQTQIDQLIAQGAAKDKALAASNEAREAGELKSAVVMAFEKAGAMNANRDYVHVLPNVKKATDGTYHTISKDQFGVETPVALDVAFGTFLKGNPELMKASGKPGSGTPAGSPSTGSGSMSTESYMVNRAKNLESGDIKVTF